MIMQWSLKVWEPFVHLLLNREIARQAIRTLSDMEMEDKPPVSQRPKTKLSAAQNWNCQGKMILLSSSLASTTHDFLQVAKQYLKNLISIRDACKSLQK